MNSAQICAGSAGLCRLVKINDFKGKFALYFFFSPLSWSGGEL
jgi:hypothetical protein